MYCVDYSDDENTDGSNDSHNELREDLLTLKNRVGQIQKDLTGGKFIEKIKTEINTIRDRLNEIKKSSEHGNIFISEIKEKIGELESRFLELQMDINKNAAKNLDPKSLIKDSLKLIKASEKKIEDIEQKIKIIDVLQKHLSQLEDRLSDFLQKNEKVESKIQNNIISLQNELNNIKKLIATLDKNLKDNNKTMNEYHAKLINQLQEVNKQISILFERVNAQDDLINGLLEGREVDKQIIEKMQTLIKEFKDEISNSQLKIDKLSKEISTLRTEKTNNKVLDNLHDKNVEEIHNLTDTVNDLKKKVDDLITLPNWLTNQLKTLEKSLIDRAKTLCTEIINNMYKQMMVTQTKMDDKIDDTYNSSRKFIEELKNELIILKTQSSTKHTDYNKIEVYENVLNSLSKRIDTLENIQSEDKSRYQITSYIKEIRSILNNINLFHILFQKNLSENKTNLLTKKDQNNKIDFSSQKEFNNFDNEKIEKPIKSQEKKQKKSSDLEKEKIDKVPTENTSDNKKQKVKDKIESPSKTSIKPKTKEEISKKIQPTSSKTESTRPAKASPKKSLLS